MKLKEITKEEFNELDNSSSTYFSYGCIFDEETENLIAFCWYKDGYSEASKWFKVVENA